MQFAYVVLAQSAPDEHGAAGEGLWVGVFKHSTPLAMLDTIWAAIVAADLWPPVRLVVIEDLRLSQRGVFTSKGTRVGIPKAESVTVRPLNRRESWLVPLGIVLGALPYAISKEVNSPLPASSRLTWITVVLEALLLFFVLMWAFGRRADGQPTSLGRPTVPRLRWVGVAIFAGAAFYGLYRTRG